MTSKKSEKKAAKPATAKKSVKKVKKTAAKVVRTGKREKVTGGERVAMVLQIGSQTKSKLIAAAKKADLSIAAFTRRILDGRIRSPLKA